MKLVILILVILFAGLGMVVLPQKRSPETMKVKIAMCQIFCLDSDDLGNFARIEHALIEAKNGGADIACFPETTILGWVNPDAHKMAHPIPGDYSNQLAALARKYSLFVVAGLAEKEDDKLFDSVVLIDDKGEVLLKHRKINILTELMTPPYTPGSEVNIVDTRFGKIGLLICADTFRQNILEKMAALQPDLLLVPYGWAAQVEEWPEHGKSLENVVKKTALKIHAPVVGTDLVGEITNGPWAGRTFGGQSVAVDKTGQVLAIAKDRDKDVQVVSIEITIK